MSLKEGRERRNGTAKLGGWFVFFFSELSLEPDTRVTGFNI